MKSLFQYGLVGYGLADKGLSSAGMIGFFNQGGGGIPSGNVWLLEYSVVPQPAGTNGIWTNDGIWKSDSIWYN